ncbi:MAG: hypothetical protein QNJ17_03395 [Desulfocapsaceae bacterium]|nr:hypothetical protein [Desulfocapsaceae bacterium]
MVTNLNELSEFVQRWQESDEGNKKGFMELMEILQAMDSVELDFVPREGITYSLRAKHSSQKEKPLFVMIDVIEGDFRWLSVCFYAEMITDPGEKGDFVPGGLLGEDACCFDMENYSDEIVGYLTARIEEACASAAGY